MMDFGEVFSTFGSKLEGTDFVGASRPQNPSPDSEFLKIFPPTLGRKMRNIYPCSWIPKSSTMPDFDQLFIKHIKCSNNLFRLL